MVTPPLPDKLKLLLMRNNSRRVRPIQKSPYGFPPLLTVIQSPMVHVHSNKLISQFHPHVPRKLQSVLHRRRAVVQAILDAGFKDAGDGAAVRFGKTLVNDVAAEGKR